MGKEASKGWEAAQKLLAGTGCHPSLKKSVAMTAMMGTGQRKWNPCQQGPQEGPAIVAGHQERGRPGSLLALIVKAPPYIPCIDQKILEPAKVLCQARHKLGPQLAARRSAMMGHPPRQELGQIMAGKRPSRAGKAHCRVMGFSSTSCIGASTSTSSPCHHYQALCCMEGPSGMRPTSSSNHSSSSSSTCRQHVARQDKGSSSQAH